MFNMHHIQQIPIVPLSEKMEIESLNHLILRLRVWAHIYSVSLTVGSRYLLMFPFGIFYEDLQDYAWKYVLSYTLN